MSNINSPEHYNKGNIEVIDAIEDWGLDFCLGNAIKYIARAGHKGKFEEDIRKAIWYLKRTIKNSDLLEKFINYEVALKCNTEEESNHLLDYLDFRGFKWYTGKSLREFKNWNTYDNSYACSIDGIEYSSEGFYRDKGFKVIEYKKGMFKQ